MSAHSVRADDLDLRFVIARRLSTIRDADMILVMEDGRIVESGSYQTLIEAGGAYADLYKSQFSGPGRTVDDIAATTSGPTTNGQP